MRPKSIKHVEVNQRPRRDRLRDGSKGSHVNVTVTLPVNLNKFHQQSHIKDNYIGLQKRLYT